MQAGSLSRQWCEILREERVRTATGAHRVELVSQGRVRCYRVKSRPYTYWQEQRASERFIDWQVELLVRADKRHDWGKVKVRYQEQLYRVMWYERERGQVRVILRMENE